MDMTITEHPVIRGTYGIILPLAPAFTAQAVLFQWCCS
jgi:hypothetical protein